MIRPKVLIFPVVLTDHVFDKVRSIDMTLAEFEQLLGTGRSSKSIGSGARN